MRTKGRSNYGKYHKSENRPDLKDGLVKFRCSASFKALIEEFRAANSKYVGGKSESDLYRSLILRGLLTVGPYRAGLTDRIQEEIEKL